MKNLLIIVFFFTCIQCGAQSIEKQIENLKAKNAAMQTSISQINTAMVTLVVLYAEKDKKIAQLSDSIRILRESIPSIVKINQKVSYLQGNITKVNDSTFLIK